MADGYILEVTIPPMAGGELVKETWYAHIADKKRAIEAVKKAVGARKEAAVHVVRAERHKVLLERLGLLEGEVRIAEGLPNPRIPARPSNYRIMK